MHGVPRADSSSPFLSPPSSAPARLPPRRPVRRGAGAAQDHAGQDGRARVQCRAVRREWHLLHRCAGWPWQGHGAGPFLVISHPAALGPQPSALDPRP
eukprot:8879693-Pyramimonas_sp.AAC.1